MRPRADLDHDHAVIIRRGIPYGEEVTAEEAAERKSAQDKERGLLFVCYQSDIRNGFNFLTTRKCFKLALLFDKGLITNKFLFLCRLGKQPPFPRSQEQFRRWGRTWY
jgi:deferrochelatase/peroxidase EfeB